MNFDEWLNSRNGTYVNIDGNYGAQCWDTWSDYAVNVIGVDYPKTGTQAGGGCPNHPGYACGIWKGFDRSGLNQWFTPVSSPQRGDVAIWDWGSAVGPNSHVAVVVSDAGGSVYCLTQNPGPNKLAYLSKSGILGYLRPDNQSLIGGGGSSASVSVSGSVSDLADAVLRGDFGNGDQRRAALGARYDEVQAEVNRRLDGGGSAPSPAAPAPSGGGVSYTVVSGDTLWGISERFYGTGTEYPRIYEANKDVIGPDPGLIYPGQTFVIP